MGTWTSGYLFSCLTCPTLVIGPIAGWARDRIGVRIPTVTSSVLQVVLFGFLGIACADLLPWTHAWGGTLYKGCIVALGIVRPITSNLGPTELSGEFLLLGIAGMLLIVYSRGQNRWKGDTGYFWAKWRDVSCIFYD